MKKIYNKVNIEEVEKKEVHKVPENYFDVLPGLIQNRISRQDGLSTNPSFFTVYWRPMLASLFVLFILGALWFVWNERINSPETVSTIVPPANPGKPNFTYLPSDSFSITNNSTDQKVNDSAPISTKQKLQNQSAEPIQNPDALLAGIDSRDIAQYLRNSEENDQEDLTEDF